MTDYLTDPNHWGFKVGGLGDDREARVEETIGRRLRRYVREGIRPNDIELSMAADAELWQEHRIANLENALRDIALKKPISQCETWSAALAPAMHMSLVREFASRFVTEQRATKEAVPPLDVLKAKRELYEGTYVPLTRLQQAQGLGLGKIYVDPDLSDDDWFVVTAPQELEK